jgi:hypothetical protein
MTIKWKDVNLILGLQITADYVLLLYLFILQCYGPRI